MKMIESDISEKLKGLNFNGYSNVIEKILRAYGIINTTIKKIQFKIYNGEPGPFPIYRRALIFCGDVEDGQLTSSLKYCPLVIRLTPQKIQILGKNENNIYDYSDLWKHYDKLEGLCDTDINKQDPYSTIEFDSLIESLYRTLKLLDNNRENDIRKFIFSLMYIAHFTCLFDIEQVHLILNSYHYTELQKLEYILQRFENLGSPYCIDKVSLKRLNLSKEAFKYIFAIIRFDTSDIDSEMLSSLIYRMVDRDSSGLYGHQTSFVNVNKLLNSLFIDEFNKKIDNASNENIYEIVTKLYDIVIFDPTNGPGCYLAASFNGIIQLIHKIENKFSLHIEEDLDLRHFIGICSNQLTQSLSILSLVFAYTKELKRKGTLNWESILGLKSQLSIWEDDELASDWNTYVKPSDSLYIVGSPTFKGRNKLSEKEKKDMFSVYGCTTLYGADYCSAWLVKAADLIKGSLCKAAFVLTNSVSQGEQSSYIHDNIEKKGCEYIFAYRSFKWKVSNDNTGVTVVIIGIGSKGTVNKKFVIDDDNIISCKSIGASLLPDIDIHIKSRSNPISPILPKMRKGNMPDGAADFLTFNSQELDAFLDEYPSAEKYIKPLYGGDEFVKGCPRWVLWITDEDLPEARKIKGIADRIEKVREYRSHSTSSLKSKNNPHKFRETNCTNKGKISVIVPCVTSENRDYFQMGILDSSAIVNNNVNVIFNCEIWILALLESRMHMVWAKNAAGGHETRPRYSSQLCYNTFPAPELNKERIDKLTSLAKLLLEVREKYCNKSLAQLYDRMPPELMRVHTLIDNTVDSFYQRQGFTSDESRLLFLKDKYNKLIENE